MYGFCMIVFMMGYRGNNPAQKLVTTNISDYLTDIIIGAVRDRIRLANCDPDLSLDDLVISKNRMNANTPEGSRIKVVTTLLLLLLVVTVVVIQMIEG